MFRLGKSNLALIKISEIGKWLEELDDKSTDVFYLSINSGLLHVLKATFIHILFATNSIEESKLVIINLFIFITYFKYSKFVFCIFIFYSEQFYD
jgi:hypothetical protein